MNMPYPGEFAHYKPLRQIVDSERVQSLLRRSNTIERDTQRQSVVPITLSGKAEDSIELPPLVLAIDGSLQEVEVKNGYPGAMVGYCHVASVIIDIAAIDKLDAHRPFNPVEFRKTAKGPSTKNAIFVK